MTSINAIKFDDYSGACVCDEARCWNDEGMKIYTAEKMKPCVPGEISQRYGTVEFMATQAPPPLEMNSSSPSRTG